MPSDREYHRKYSASHREESRAAHKRWYEKHGAERRATNSEKIRTSGRKYYYKSTGQPDKAEREAELFKQLSTQSPAKPAGPKTRYSAEENKQRRMASMRKMRYKVAEFTSLDDYVAPEHCEVCSSTKKICLDHDHVTGAFRGWLCDRCNRLLGAAKDDAELLQNAIAYLQRKDRKQVFKSKHNIVLVSN